MKSYNLNTFFGEDLRPIPENKKDFELYIIELEKNLLLENNELEKAKILSELGFRKGILNNLESAKDNLEMALKIFEKIDDKKRIIISKIRLATIIQWMKNFNLANEIFKEIIFLVNNNFELELYKDFAYQHYGKNLFDQCLYNQALEQFKKSLEIRIKKEEKELIDSTLFAIKITQKIILEKKL